MNPLSYFGSKSQSISEVVQQVASQDGLSGKVVKLKKQLETEKQQKTVQAELNAELAAIDALSDIKAVTTVFEKLRTSTELLKKVVEARKQGLVGELRHVEVSNRKQGKLLDEQRVMRSTLDALSPTKTLEGKYAKLWLTKVRDGSQLREAAQSAQAGYKHIQERSSHVINVTLPELQPKVNSQVAKLEAFSKKLSELNNQHNQSLDKLKSDLDVAKKEGRAGEVSQLRTQIDHVNDALGDLKKLRKQFEDIEHDVELAGVDLRAIEELGARVAVNRSDVKDLPFNLAMLANGKESPSIENGCSLNQALLLGNSGSGNHVAPRALTLSHRLAEFGSDLNLFQNEGNPTPTTSRGDKRSFLAALGGALRANEEKSVNDVLNFMSRPEGRKHVHHLAAINLVAAGFNTETLSLDAPSLAYKVESGLSGLKKWFITPTGKFARNPEEHIGVRLTLLGHVSEVLQRELFRNGKPVSLEHAVITPQHAVEASSLIIAALPNDLLTIHGDEVTRFVGILKKFEAEVAASTKEKPLDPRSMIAFKRTLNDFHQQAGQWLTERAGAGGAANSLASARQISADLASKARKGFFRQAKASTGNFINLAGGRLVREGWSAFRAYVGQINQKERMCQAIRSPVNVVQVAQMKRDLMALAEKEPGSSANAKALISYLDGRSLNVELKDPLSPRMIIELKRTGDFLQKAWAPVSKGKQAPTVIGLSASQTNEIPGFVHTKLSQFVGNPLSGSQSSTPESAPTVVPARSGAAATSFRVEATNKLSNNQWVVAMWGKVLNHAGQPRTKQLHILQKDYERVFLTNYPEGASPPSEVEVKKYHENRSAMAAISAHIASEVKDIPSDIVSKMKELTPLLLDITRGHVLTTELADLNTRVLQNVAPDKNRCWLRSAWGVAAQALSKEDFTTRVSQIGSDLTTSEIQEIYDQTTKAPLSGMINNPALENKQVNLMIGIAKKQAKAWSSDARATLQALEAKREVQAEGDFGAAFLNALSLPVVIRNGNGDAPDIYLPENFSVDQQGHPDTWPTLRYDGTGNTGHWQFYQKPAAA